MASWHNAPKVTKLTASQQGGNRGAQLWGVDNRGVLYTTYQTTPGGEWSPWKGPDWAGGGFPKQVYELAATQQEDGRVISQLPAHRLSRNKQVSRVVLLRVRRSC